MIKAVQKQGVFYGLSIAGKVAGYAEAAATIEQNTHDTCPFMARHG
jgi:hypothetical protein